MVIIIGAVVMLAAVIIPNLRLPRLGRAPALGWMNQQWLSEHRASHS